MNFLKRVQHIYLFYGTETTVRTIWVSFILNCFVFALIAGGIFFEMDDNYFYLALLVLVVFPASFRNGLLMFPSVRRRVGDGGRSHAVR